MLIISPSSFVHVAQTKPVQVLPTQTKEKTASAGVIRENMHHDNAEEEYIELFSSFWTFTCWNLHSSAINHNSEASVVV